MCDHASLSIVDKYGLSQHVKWPTRDNRTLDLSDLAFAYLGSNPVLCSVDDNWSSIASNILQAADNHVPHKMSKPKRHLPWVSPSIKRMMNRRNRAFKKARRTWKSHHFDTYKNLRNNTSKRLRAAKSKYLNEVMGGLAPDTDQASAHGSVKRSWSYLKLLRTDSIGIPTLFWDNRVCSSNQAKAEALRGHMPASPFSDVPDIYFSSPGVLKQLGAIRPDKARCPDQIPARILREAAAKLAPVFASLFQQSYEPGIFPTAWKDANITAIFKKGTRSEPFNYRPVSLTSLTSKVMEHIVCSQMRRHLSSHSVISPHQHGFLRGLSCETQLISVVHEWARTLNAHGQAQVILRRKQGVRFGSPRAAAAQGTPLRLPRENAHLAAQLSYKSKTASSR